MAYQLTIFDKADGYRVVFEQELGSAIMLDLYWESVARRLELLLLSGMSAHASDKECGFFLEKKGLEFFRQELLQLERYWLEHEAASASPAIEKGAPDTPAEETSSEDSEDSEAGDDWVDEEVLGLPDGFLITLRTIIDEVGKAGEKGYCLSVG